MPSRSKTTPHVISVGANASSDVHDTDGTIEPTLRDELTSKSVGFNAPPDVHDTDGALEPALRDELTSKSGAGKPFRSQIAIPPQAQHDQDMFKSLSVDEAELPHISTLNIGVRSRVALDRTAPSESSSVRVRTPGSGAISERGRAPRTPPAAVRCAQLLDTDKAAARS